MKDKPMKVLLIEGNSEDAGLLQEMLAQVDPSPFELVWVKELSMGLEQLTTNTVDAVLVDLSLPDSDELSIITRIHHVVAHIPVVVLTASDNDPLVVAAMQEGAQDYLVKGEINKHLLVRVVRYAIERQQTEEKLRTNQEYLDTILLNLPVGIAIFGGPEFQYLRINHTLAEINGLSVEDHLGKSLVEVLPHVAPNIVPGLRKVLETGEPSLQREFSARLPKDPDKDRYFIDSFFPIKGDNGKPEAVGTVVREITQRKQVERELEQRAAQLALINKIGSKIAAELKLESVLDKAARLVQETFDYHHVALFLVDEETIRLKAVTGLYETYFPSDHVQQLGEGINGWVATHGKKIVANDVSLEPYYISLITEHTGTQAELCLPIKVSAQTVGVLDIQSPQLNAFSENDVIAMEALTNQIAVAIVNARLYDQIRQELAERKQAEAEVLELNRKLITLQYAGATIASSLDFHYVLDTITREMINLLGVEGCVVAEWNQVDHTLVVLVRYGPSIQWDKESLGQAYPLENFPLHIQVLKKRQAQQVTISRPDIDLTTLTYMQRVTGKTLLLLPMEFQDQVLGLVDIFDTRTERIFTDDEVALAQLLANQAASAFKNVRLYDEIRRHVDELTTLNKVSQSINSTLNLQETLTLITDHTIRLLNVAATSIALYDDTKSDLWFAAASGEGADFVRGKRLAKGQGIVGWVTQHNQPLLVPDVMKDPRFYKNFDQQSGFATRSILCVPLQTKGRTIGAVEVINKKDRPFDKEDWRLLDLLAAPAAIAIENAHLYNQAQQEITERKRVEKALTESLVKIEQIKQEWETTADSLSELVCLLDDQARIIRANRTVERWGLCPIVGVSQVEIHELLHPGCVDPACYLPTFWPQAWAEIKQDRPVELEIEDKILQRHLHLQIRPIVTPITELKITGSFVVVVIHDITKRKQTEQEIYHQNRELTLLNQIISASTTDLEPEALLETACRGLALALNLSQATVALLNKEKTEAVVIAEYLTEGRPTALHHTIPIIDNPSFEYLLEYQSPLVIEDAQHDPRLAPIHHLMQKRESASILLLPLTVEGEVVGSLGLDAVEPHHFSAGEISLAWSVADQMAGALTRIQSAQIHRQLITAIEQAAESVVITDTKGIILYVNPTFEQITGYSRAEVLGQTPRILKSGQLDPDFYQELWTTITAGEVWHGRFVNKKKDGTLYTEDATISPVRDESGNIINYVAVIYDVTHELELEEQYRQAQKMEAIGLLAGGVAHDFNNILTVIIGHSHLLLDDYYDPLDPRRQEVEQIRAAGERAAMLTRQLLAFSRRHVSQLQILNINDIITNLEKMLRRLIGENITLLTNLSPDLGHVKADQGQLEQIFMNLVINARDAMPQGGKLTIETANINADQTQFFELPSTPHIILTVTDTGSGMDAETQTHIFDPFFTTKEMGKGTGLGLSTVYGIVQQSKGHIQVDSTLGKGTTFKIYLPQAKPTTKSTLASSLALAAVQKGNETVLLVEDEASVRLITRKFLQKQGYTVFEADHPDVAIEVYRQHKGHIDLLITDVVMPDMSGRELAQQLYQIQSDLKVLYISGYTDDALSRHGVLAPDIVLLEKPFTSNILARKVQQALNAP